MSNNAKNAKQDKNIDFLKFFEILLLVVFILIDIGIYRSKIIIFHYGILAIIFFIMGTIWIKIGPDGIKFGSSNAKEKKQSNTTNNFYDNRKIYYPNDTTSSFPDHDNNI